MYYADHNLLSVHIVAEFDFCPRSAYLLMTGAESAKIVTGSFREGAVLHQTVDEGGERMHRGKTVVRALRVSSATLGITGIIDQVTTDSDGVVLWEYKRGKMREARTHELQLALLGLCYAEQFGMRPAAGKVWTMGDRRSRALPLNDELYADASRIALAMREATRGVIPWPKKRQPACGGCIYRYSCWTESQLAKI